MTHDYALFEVATGVDYRFHLSVQLRKPKSIDREAGIKYHMKVLQSITKWSPGPLLIIIEGSISWQTNCYSSTNTHSLLPSVSNEKIITIAAHRSRTIKHCKYWSNASSSLEKWDVWGWGCKPNNLMLHVPMRFIEISISRVKLELWKAMNLKKYWYYWFDPSNIYF